MNHEEHDCLMVVVMSHGMGPMIYAKDAIYNIDETETESMVASLIETDTGSYKNYSIPTYADFFMMHTTQKGYVSYRHPFGGSWFIQSLCTEVTDNFDCFPTISTNYTTEKATSTTRRETGAGFYSPIIQSRELYPTLPQTSAIPGFTPGPQNNNINSSTSIDRKNQLQENSKLFDHTTRQIGRFCWWWSFNKN
ncbi:hypothetical protein KQX54_006148 [Cotesia glomerata]|uniref:Caspase family p10 domain-containing protein n=1 Tax=Cotesia glomerata TaxID=32391 RepID=A0AAV7IIW3_COTGL|nr:hypothetical protein KQX54_006148 [Cotesia glomerata]